ncbi:MAG: site-2 protease family protein [Fimbriimonadaceae bacterium]
MPQATEIGIYVAVILLSISVHEYAHAKIADMSGDDTPRLMGRVTLVPWKHWDPVGTVMILITAIAGVGIGWGKPVTVNPNRMRNPRWDHFWSVAAGPLSNLLIAGFFGAVLRFLLPLGPTVLNDGLLSFLLIAVYSNIGLFLFNLMPLGPLDGHWLVGAFLPDGVRERWYMFNRTVGGLVLLALVFFRTDQFDPLGQMFGPIREAVFRIIVGA